MERALGWTGSPRWKVYFLNRLTALFLAASCVSHHAPFREDGPASEEKHQNAQREADGTTDDDYIRNGRLV